MGETGACLVRQRKGTLHSKGCRSPQRNIQTAHRRVELFMGKVARSLFEKQTIDAIGFDAKFHYSDRMDRSALVRPCLGHTVIVDFGNKDVAIKPCYIGMGQGLSG